MTDYKIGKQVHLSYEAAVETLRQELPKEGFGILTEIDVCATLKKKIDKDIPPYIILGACNPTLASQAIEEDPSIGALLPCNVVVRVDLKGDVFVEYMNPVSILGLTQNPTVQSLSHEVKEKLDRVMAGI